MADQTSIDELNRNLNAERMAFNAARRQLVADLKGLSDPESLADQLISHAGEFGADAAVTSFQVKPSEFQQTQIPAPELAATIKLPLVAAYDHDARMDAILAERETLLANDDPERQRVFQLFGRECTIDPENQRIRYLDTGTNEQTQVIAVNTRQPVNQRPRSRTKSP